MDNKEVLMDVCNILLDQGTDYSLIKRLEAIIANTPEGITTGETEMKVEMMDDKEVLMDVCNILLDHNVAMGDGHCLIKRLEAIIANTPEGITTGETEMKVEYRNKEYMKIHTEDAHCEGCCFLKNDECSLPDSHDTPLCYDRNGNYIFKEIKK